MSRSENTSPAQIHHLISPRVKNWPQMDENKHSFFKKSSLRSLPLFLDICMLFTIKMISIKSDKVSKIIIKVKLLSTFCFCS